jgi:hypothetical protein
MVDGLEKEDVKGLVEQFNIQQGCAPAKSDDKADDAKDEKQEDDDPYAVYKKLAKTLARSESRRLWKWVKASPTSLRVLSFVSGLFMFVAAIFGFLTTLFSGTHRIYL